MKLPIGKKRSRYDKARTALRDMLPHRQRQKHVRSRREAKTNGESGIAETDHGFAGLHWMTAGLFVAAGAEAALGERRGDYRPSDAVRWGPVIAAPLAGAAQAARAIWPSPTTRTVAQIVNGVAVAVGACGIASSVRAAIDDRQYGPAEPGSFLERVPSLAPLAFGAVGLLGLLLESEEDETSTHEVMRTQARPHRNIKAIRIRV